VLDDGGMVRTRTPKRLVFLREQTADPRRERREKLPLFPPKVSGEVRR
jgi:hypothetical protein